MILFTIGAAFGISVACAVGAVLGFFGYRLVR